MEKAGGGCAEMRFSKGRDPGDVRDHYKEKVTTPKEKKKSETPRVEEHTWRAKSLTGRQRSRCAVDWGRVDRLREAGRNGWGGR